MHKSWRFLLVTVVLGVIFLLLPARTFAHRLIVQHLAGQENMLQVLYDDGTAASRATISLVGENGAVIWTGSADSNGNVKLPGYTYTKGVADDGLGHRIMFTPGEKSQVIPRWLAATGGVALLLFVAALAKFFSKRKLAGDNNDVCGNGKDEGAPAS
ncbi:MAG: hypothetical protein KGZ41_00475 [Dethiobacter sp.]|jgi:hypothetical protein|nr:hypothetical protein [Dethiobacter sp.]MBS3982253.1 hypothetical protein [Dethiobacter sp.]MCL4463854.1 hypothetical protein [Bacillota bacterium]MCL5994307.1 hypothetical protein [Bacillota bacterium]